MKKAPKYLHARGALGYQLSLLPDFELSPIPTPKGTREALALVTLACRPLNQIIWLKMNQGWRLAVTINQLRNMGWAIKTEMKFLPNGEHYGEYSLLDCKQREQVTRMFSVDTEGMS
jgi:hypothetical protein